MLRYYSFISFIIIQIAFSYTTDTWKKIPKETQPLIKVVFEMEKRHFQESEPIFVKVTFKNIKPSPELLELKLKKKLFPHFHLTLKSENNIEMEASKKYLMWQYDYQKNNQPRNDNTIEENIKTVEMAYLETYSTKINLLDWFVFDQSGRYFLKGSFIYNPETSGNTIEYIANDISFVVEVDFNHQGKKSQIPFQDSQYSKTRFSSWGETAFKRIQNSIPLPPYEVVKLFLSGEQKEEWELHFKTLDLPTYLVNSYFTTDIYERYISALEDEKAVILDDFKNFLISKADYKIKSFKILQSVINQNEAEVAVGVMTKTSIQNKVNRFNPTNGQIENVWASDNNEFLEEYKVIYFNLKNYYDQWKIVEKRIGNQKSQEFVYPQKSIPDLHLKEPDLKVFDNILFYQGTTNIVKDKEIVLDRLVKHLLNKKKVIVHLYGHTDDRGSSKENQILSQNRVLKIKEELVKAGISPERMHLYWYGENKPLHPNIDEDKRSLNRRVEIKIQNLSG